MKGRIQHVGVVVEDLADMRAFLEEVLGFRLARAQSLPTGVETAFFAQGDQDVQVELVAIPDAAERARRMAGGGPSRLDHIAIEVDDIDVARAELTARGVTWQRDEPSRNGPTRSYFTRPESCRGVVFQILDRRVS